MESTQTFLDRAESIAESAWNVKTNFSGYSIGLPLIKEYTQLAKTAGYIAIHIDDDSAIPMLTEFLMEK